MKKWLVLCVAILGIIVLASCSSNTLGSITPTNTTSAQPSSTTQISSTPTQTLTPQSGGTLSMLIQEPVSLGYPALMTGTTDGRASSVCLETLFRFDEQSNVVPLLATDWKADAIAKTITITLRKGVKFQDGTDFNAQAVKWNLDTFKNAGRPELKRVTSVDAVDDYTVRLNLSTFDNTIITNLADNAGRMISPAAFNTNGGKDWAQKNPVGTGPFQFVSWQKDVGIKWTRFDAYWGGKPYLDGIEMKRYADATVALMDFKAGNLTMFSPTPKDSKDLEAQGKYNMVLPPEGTNPSLTGYAKDPSSPFSKLEVRQAISYAIDSKSIATSMGFGYWTAQNQFSVPGSWGSNPAVVGYPYNPQKAKDLLAAAGYPTGFKTTLNFFNISQIYVDEMTAIQNYLQTVGIDATINALQRPAFSDMASNQKGWSGLVRLQMYTSPDPLVQYSGVAGGTDYAGMYLPIEFTDLYNQAIAAPDFATKQKLTQQLMALTTDKFCMVNYLYVQTPPVFKAKTLHDDMYGTVPNGWISPKAWLSK